MRSASVAWLVELDRALAEMADAGLFKRERELLSGQGVEIEIGRSDSQRKALNFCANNYLGLARDPVVVEAARQAIDRYGVGMASVRFICGTLDLHRTLEREIADFLGQDDAVLYAACFDANGGLFETLLDERDAVISDALNHASIIDGIRLCKARRYRFGNGDMAALAGQLAQAGKDGARRKVIVTDGVFSMDGCLARLPEICDLADQHDALVMVDDSHGIGVLGATGGGTVEHCGVSGRVDIITGTLGKAIGGSMGGFVAARRQIAEMLRQRSRPYLFSNALSPVVVEASRAALRRLREEPDLRHRLLDNARQLRVGLERLGYRVLPGEHPIVPVLVGDAVEAQRLAESLLDQGIYAVAFRYPVVPEGAARIRLQASSLHSQQHIDDAIAAFARAGRTLGLVA